MYVHTVTRRIPCSSSVSGDGVAFGRTTGDPSPGPGFRRLRGAGDGSLRPSRRLRSRNTAVSGRSVVRRPARRRVARVPGAVQPSAGPGAGWSSAVRDDLGSACQYGTINQACASNKSLDLRCGGGRPNFPRPVASGRFDRRSMPVTGGGAGFPEGNPLPSRVAGLSTPVFATPAAETRRQPPGPVG